MLTALALGPLAAGAAVQDRPWCVTGGPHFELVTDLRKRDANALATALDRFRVASTALLPGRPAAPARRGQRPPLRLLVFKRARDFAAMFQLPAIAGFSAPSLNQSLLVFRRGADGGLDTIAFHEYTHYLLRTRVALNLPIWYEEGFASYLATLQVEEGVVTTGRGPHGHLRHLLMREGSLLDDMLKERHQLDWHRHDLPRVYVMAWGVVRFLLHAPRPQGGRFAAQVGAMLEAIDAGATTDAALAAELGLDAATLRAAMLSFYERTAERPPVFKFPLPNRSATDFAHRCLSDADRRVALAQAIARRRPAAAEALLREALADAPRHAAALVALSRVQADAGLALATASAARRLAPRDAHTHVRFAEARIARCETAGDSACDDAWAEATRACATARDLDPGRADARYCLGLGHLRANRAAAALTALRVALAQAPWSPRVHYHLGLAYGRLGARREARTHLRKTAYWHPQAEWRDRALAALARLDDAERGAVTNPPAVPE